MMDRYNREPFPDIWDGTFHVYVYLRSEGRMVYGGLFLHKEAAMDDVRNAVKKLGLRCLFRWDESGNYRCGGDDKHIYGRITLERTDAVKSIEYLPFDRLETS